MWCVMLGVSVPMPKVKVTVRVQMLSHLSQILCTCDYSILSEFDREVILQKTSLFVYFIFPV